MCGFQAEDKPTGGSRRRFLKISDAIITSWANLLMSSKAGCFSAFLLLWWPCDSHRVEASSKTPIKTTEHQPRLFYNHATPNYTGRTFLVS